MGWTDVHSVGLQSYPRSRVQLPVPVMWWLNISETAWEYTASWALHSAEQHGQRTVMFLHAPVCSLLQVTEKACCSWQIMHSCREVWALLTQSQIVGVSLIFMGSKLALPGQWHDEGSYGGIHCWIELKCWKDKKGTSALYVLDCTIPYFLPVLFLHFRQSCICTPQGSYWPFCTTRVL